MSVSTVNLAVDPTVAATSSRQAARRATGDLPTSLHVVFDIGLADDCAQVRAALKALVELQSVTGARVRLGTAGGPSCLGHLDHDRLERVAIHLSAYARGIEGCTMQSTAIARTGPRHPRLARLVGKRPLAVLVTSRPPADPVATARALSRSARSGARWLVVTTTPGIPDAAFRTAVTAVPDGVSVAEVTGLRDGPDPLVRTILSAWNRCPGRPD